MQDNREKIHQIISQTVGKCLPKYNSGLVLPVCDLFLQLEELGEFSLISKLKESLVPFGFNPDSPNYGWCRQPDKQGLIRYLCELQSSYGKEPVKTIQPKFPIPDSRFLFQNPSKTSRKVVIEPKQGKSVLKDFPDGVILPNEILLHILRFSDPVTIFPLVHWDFLTEGLLSHLVLDEEMWSQALKAYNPYFSDLISIPNRVFKGKIMKVRKSAFARFSFVRLAWSSIHSPWTQKDLGIFSFLKFVQAPITSHPILLGEEKAVLKGVYHSNKSRNPSFLGEIVSGNLKINVHAQVCEYPSRVLSLSFDIHPKENLAGPYISIRRSRGSFVSFEIFYPRILPLGTSENQLIREMFSLDISVDTYNFRRLLLEEFKNNHAYYEKILLKRFER